MGVQVHGFVVLLVSYIFWIKGVVIFEEFSTPTLGEKSSLERSNAPDMLAEEGQEPIA